MSWLRNPGAGRAGCLLVTVLYIVWSILPVAIAVLFAFNDGRSRTTWQGFSITLVHGCDRAASCTIPRSRAR